MSWSIFISGERNNLVPVPEARQKATAATCYEQNNGPAASQNEQQFEGARGLILGELARLPAGHGVFVSASGHADNDPLGSSNISFTMNTGPLPVIEP